MMPLHTFVISEPVMHTIVALILGAIVVVLGILFYENMEK